MRKIVWIGVAVLVAAVVGAHLYFADRGRFTTAPERSGLLRSVSDQDLISDRDPPIVLRFAPQYRYLGGQKFVLYGVADTEQHFFVEAGEDGRLVSFYWVQYEAYLPGKRYRYDYDDSPLRTTLGGIEFYTDFEVVAVDPDRKRRRGTDGALMREFLAAEGYSLPDEFAYARLVYLTDATRKKELMIIFIDDLVRYGVDAATLEEEAGGGERRRAVERQHLERIEATLDVLPGPAGSVSTRARPGGARSGVALSDAVRSAGVG